MLSDHHVALSFLSMRWHIAAAAAAAAAAAVPVAAAAVTVTLCIVYEYVCCCHSDSSATIRATASGFSADICSSVASTTSLSAPSIA